MKTTFIYALCEPDNEDAVRYIGKSNNPKQRLICHFRDARNGEETHKADWLRKLVNQGKKPVIEILFEVLDKEWQRWERATIRFFKAVGADLVNGTDGGDGVSWPGELHPLFGRGHSEETKIKMRKPKSQEHREALKGPRPSIQGSKNPFFGKKHSEETKQKIRDSLKRSRESKHEQRF